MRIVMKQEQKAKQRQAGAGLAAGSVAASMAGSAGEASGGTAWEEITVVAPERPSESVLAARRAAQEAREASYVQAASAFATEWSNNLAEARRASYAGNKRAAAAPGAAQSSTAGVADRGTDGELSAGGTGYRIQGVAGVADGGLSAGATEPPESSEGTRHRELLIAFRGFPAEATEASVRHFLEKAVVGSLTMSSSPLPTTEAPILEETPILSRELRLLNASRGPPKTATDAPILSYVRLLPRREGTALLFDGFAGCGSAGVQQAMLSRDGDLAAEGADADATAARAAAAEGRRQCIDVFRASEEYMASCLAAGRVRVSVSARVRVRVVVRVRARARARARARVGLGLGLGLGTLHGVMLRRRDQG